MKIKQGSRYYYIVIISVFIISAFLLLITKSLTTERIKTLNDVDNMEMLHIVFIEANSYTLIDTIYTVYDENLNILGRAFLAKGNGVEGPITILVGLEDKETIKGINIISHREITVIPIGEGEEGPPLDFSVFIKQFNGLKIDDCALTTDRGSVDGISGATMSSNVVVNTVRETILEKLKLIK